MIVRKFSGAVRLLVLLGLLLASCAPAAQPTPTAKTAAAPAATAATAAPATPTPAAPAATATTVAPATPKPAAPAATPKPAADQPRYGGILTLGTSSDPPNLDLVRESSSALSNTMSAVYSGLVQSDPLANEKIVPDLAERWDLSADGMAYTFFLRKDVKWHDGKAFTSSDAKFSLDKLPVYSTWKKPLLDPVSGVETTGEYSVKVALKYPSASIPAVLALGNMPMGPKHVIEAKGDLKNDVVGTGPFKFKRYDLGTSLELVKNPAYFIPGRPYLDGIIYYVIKDRATFLAAFRTGRIKMPVPAAKFTPDEAKAIQKNAPQAVVDPFDSLGASVLIMNTTQKPWDDIRVRRAAHLATDRQAAVKVISDGEGQLGAAPIAGQWAIPNDELLKQPGFRQPKDADVAEAKRLLAEAGFASGFETKILTQSGYGDYMKTAEFMADQLSKIGIRATLEPSETAVYQDRMNRGAFATMAIRIGPSFSDPDASAAYLTKGVRYGINDDRLEELFLKQGRTTDPVERKKLVLELQYRVLETAPYVFNFWFATYIPYWPEVKNYKAGVGLHNNSKYQEVWLAK